MEVLSPAGDLENFYTAIRSGADAVYFGLNKFNARMKADNISLNNIRDVVSFAHLKGVKVYITLNTLVSDKEMFEVIDMVRKCLDAGVDAFIVQDYGIIGTLKKIFPDIVLHGSTQLGVHNIRGARVAKKLGLSRVVLSREVTLEDIREISENIDIELEVFVQGAMCVCFSGNCYISSIKCGASGNRGECKQLCRLPYTLSCGNKSLDGYTISPRDNCMLNRLSDLAKAGVVSLKIEGRLRRKGYVNIATRVYREAMDEMMSIGKIDRRNEKISSLKKVFSRGEFIEGYFNGNNIIDTHNNNHMGECIGSVISCKKFKDMYRIELDCNCSLHTGDGLKIINNSDIVTLGVGNIEYNGKNVVVYGKNYVANNAKVYRVLDSEFEESVVDHSRYRTIDMNFVASVGSACTLTVSCDGNEYTAVGVVCERAKQRGTSEDVVHAQLSKLGEHKEYFRVGNISCQLGGDVFLPVSELNKLRRDCLSGLIEKILLRPSIICDGDIASIKLKALVGSDISSLAIVGEGFDKNIIKGYDGVIFSPSIYSVGVLDAFYNKIRKVFIGKILLNLPIIALGDDLKIIDEMVDYCSSYDIGIVANNIYALDYIGRGVEILAGSNMNICNKYAIDTLADLGVKDCVASIEKWCNPPAGTFKMCNGKRVLMTFAHCPSKTLSSKDCDLSVCGYCGTMGLSGGGGRYSLRRYKVCGCYWELVDSRVESKESEKSIDDYRE